MLNHTGKKFLHRRHCCHRLVYIVVINVHRLVYIVIIVVIVLFTLSSSMFIVLFTSSSLLSWSCLQCRHQCSSSCLHRHHCCHGLVYIVVINVHCLSRQMTKAQITTLSVIETNLTSYWYKAAVWICEGLLSSSTLYLNTKTANSNGYSDRSPPALPPLFTHWCLALLNMQDHTAGRDKEPVT